MTALLARMFGHDETPVTDETAEKLAAVAASEAALATKVERVKTRRAYLEEQQQLAKADSAALMDGDEAAQTQRLAIRRRQSDLKDALDLCDEDLATLAAEGAEYQSQRQAIQADAVLRQKEADWRAAGQRVLTTYIEADRKMTETVRILEAVFESYDDYQKVAARTGHEAAPPVGWILALSTHFCGSESVRHHLGVSFTCSLALAAAAGRLEFSDLVSDWASPDAEPVSAEAESTDTNVEGDAV